MDQEFVANFVSRKLYAAGETRDRAKYILERLEGLSGAKESVSAAPLTIEHVMPQTLTDWWREHIGPDWEEVHEIYVHTIGNLTLSGYNQELSNSDFTRKRELLTGSNISLNREFSRFNSWKKDEIEARAKALSERALAVWPNFAPGAASRGALEVRGTTPRVLEVLGQRHDVRTWQDVLKITLMQVCELGSDVVDGLVEEFPRLIRKGNSGMRNPRALVNGAYYESHLNAEQIHRLCSQIVQHIGFTADEWRVTTSVNASQGSNG